MAVGNNDVAHIGREHNGDDVIIQQSEEALDGDEETSRDEREYSWDVQESQERKLTSYDRPPINDTTNRRMGQGMSLTDLRPILDNQLLQERIGRYGI